MSCKCYSSTMPEIRLRPPPDPSLVWHLLSDEPFEKAPDCVWSPLLGGAPSLAGAISPPTLILGAALLLVAVLAAAVICAFCIVVKRRTVCKGSEAVSTEAIVTSGDHLWSYNSMKSHHATHQNPMVGSMYGSSGMVHGVATPASLRHYNNNVQHVQQQQAAAAAAALRHASSQPHFVRQGTMRILPGSPPGVDPSAFHTLGRHYEEIGGDYGSHHTTMMNGGYQMHAAHQQPHHHGLPYVVNCGDGRISYTLGNRDTPPSRHSVRKPPPACRPPPPPRSEQDLPSPRSASSSSSSSFDHELSTVMMGPAAAAAAAAERGGASMRRQQRPAAAKSSSRREYLGPTTLADCGPVSSNEGDASPPLMNGGGGRESGYGTAPSRQWRTPPGSSGGVDIEADSPPLHAAPSLQQQSMTYV